MDLENYHQEILSHFVSRLLKVPLYTEKTLNTEDECNLGGNS